MMNVAITPSFPDFESDRVDPGHPFPAQAAIAAMLK
jgi:hypothetical protein